MKRIRRFFSPAPGSSPLRRAMPYVLVLGAPLLILLAAPAAWDYSNSVEFCGTTCHTMPPEYNTYLVSPHARVLCVDCHIGRDWTTKQIIRKSGHMRLVWATLTHSYEYPIRTSSMRPARETCERCHYPQKFSDDSLRVIHRFEDDEDNTPYDLYLLMHTGGGSQREGLGQGIHWHVENTIEYIALDREEQEIPWVRVHYDDGTTTDYVSTDSTIDPAKLDEYDIHKMDCISCHNRISHLIDNPRNLVDKALYRGDLSAEIPFIRSQAVDVLSGEYESDDEAKTAIAGLSDYYQTNYPEFYAENGAQIDGAVALLTQLYEDNSYVDQELDWQTHPNNIGHRDSPGCFRCHDGKHVSPEQEVIRLECNLCHSIPQVVKPNVIEPMMPLTTGIEPASHLDSTWISRHHVEMNETCSNCHTMENPGSTTDTSFCSNSGCHGVDWRYAGFDAASLAVELGIEQQPTEAPDVTVTEGEAVTYQVLQPIFEAKCGQCHGATPTKGLRVTEYDTLMAGSSDGPVIVPGSPDDSKIVQVISGGHFAQLSESELALLRQWIADGAPEGEMAAPEATSEATEASGEGESFWGAATPVPTEGSESSFWAATEEASSTPAPAPTTAPTAVPETTEAGTGGSFWDDATPTPTADSGASFWDTQPTAAP